VNHADAFRRGFRAMAPRGLHRPDSHRRARTIAFAAVTRAETGHASTLRNVDRRFGGAPGMAVLSGVLAAGTAAEVDTGPSIHSYRAAFLVTDFCGPIACGRALLDLATANETAGAIT
jgi:hypothetical protein